MRYLVGLVCALALGLVGCSETSGTGGTAGDGGDGGTAGIGGGGMGGDAGHGGGGMGGEGGAGGAYYCELVFCEDDGNECTSDGVCDPVDGVCKYQPVEDGTACDESNECSVGVCADGECDVASVADGTACDEGNECTVGVCADGGCQATVVTNGTACADDAGSCETGACQVACTEQGIRAAVAAGGGPYTFACDPGDYGVVTEAEIVIDNDVILDGGFLDAFDMIVRGNGSHRVFSVLAGYKVELRHLRIENGATNDVGGGVMNAGILTIADSVIAKNSAESDGGGIWNDGTLVLRNTTIKENVAGVGDCFGAGPCVFGGGIYNSGQLTFEGTAEAVFPQSIVWGNVSNVGGGIYNEGSLRLFGVQVRENTHFTITRGSCGAGLTNDGDAVVRASTFAFNAAACFGGISNDFRASLTLVDSTISQNLNGGLYNSSDDGTLLVRTTVAGNAGRSEITTLGWGGLELLNSTVSGTSGAINGDYIKVTNSTIVGDIGTSGGQGDPGGSMRGSIVVGSCSVWFESQGYNIESPGSTCRFAQPTDQADILADDLKLGPLQDNGGLTQTHALYSGSVAIDVIPAAWCEPLTSDQRGEPRPETGGTMCDVGAFELQP